MASGRGHSIHSSDHFDLLPFIAILMCVLGVLLLVTISLAALAMGPSVREGWIPGPDRLRGKAPVLIEWDGSVATFHAEGKRLTVANLASDARSDAAELVDLARRSSTHYALFAVRPAGFGNFQQLAKRFRDLGIEIGYEPIHRDKSVDLLGAPGQ